MPKPPRASSLLDLSARAYLLDSLEVILRKGSIIREKQRGTLCRAHVCWQPLRIMGPSIKNENELGGTRVVRVLKELFY